MARAAALAGAAPSIHSARCRCCATAMSSCSKSKAIATYLDRSFPGPQLIPSDPRLAALTEQWVSLVNTVMDRTLIRTYLYAYIAPKNAGTPDRAAIDAVMPALREQLGILDRAVARTGYLVGDQFTFADVNLMPILRSGPAGARRRRRACRCQPSRRLLRHPRGAAKFCPHHAARRPAGTGQAELITESRDQGDFVACRAAQTDSDTCSAYHTIDSRSGPTAVWRRCRTRAEPFVRR